MALYFVKNAGNDSDTGLSDVSAWKTISKVNGFTFASGDTVQFNSGDIWHEQLTVPRSVTAYTNYGVGNLPIIAASDTTTSWTSSANTTECFTDGTGFKPEAWYTLTESTGTRFDGNSTNTNTLSVISGTVGRTTGPTPYVPFAALFSGDSSFLNKTDASLSAGFPGKSTATDKDVTWGCWINPSSQTLNRGIMAKDFCYFMYTAQGQLAVAAVDNAFGWHQAFSGLGKIPCGVWTHVAGTWTQSTGVVSAWINGAVVATSTTSTMLQTATAFKIGQGDYTHVPFHGGIAEPFVFAQSLTTAQIVDIMNGSLSGSTTTVYSHGGITTDPGTVAEDNIVLQPMAAKSNLQRVGSFWWDSTATVFVRTREDDDVANHTIDIGARDRGIWVSAKTSVTIQNINTRGSRTHGIELNGDFSNAIVNGVVSELNASCGIKPVEQSATIVNNVTVSNSTFRNNFNGGIDVAVTHWSLWTFNNNDCYNNGLVSGNLNHLPAALVNDNQNASGLKLFSAGQSGGTGTVVSNNRCYSNGSAVGPNTRGMGLWFDTVSGISCTGNTAYNNYGGGLVVEKNLFSLIARNLLYNNGLFATSCQPVIQGNFNGNLVVQAGAGLHVKTNRFYHNTIYGGWWGLEVTSVDASLVSSNTFQNNSAVSAGWFNLFAATGGDNDGTHGAGNVYTYNNFGAQAAGFVSWTTGRATYSALSTAYGSEMSNAQGDPLFNNVAANDYTLTAASPCVNSGVIIAGINDGTGGSAVYQGTAPDIGAFEFQNPAVGGSFVNTIWTEPEYVRRIRVRNDIVKQGRTVNQNPDQED